MRNMTKFFCAAIILIGFAQSSFGQVTATATATATIVTPITITFNNDMNFGNLFSAASIGTVELTPASARNVGGGVTLAPGGAPAAAQFTVGGTGLVSYSITLPSTDLTLTNAALNTMTVNGWTSTPTTTGTIGAGGTQVLRVGATLNVGASQPAGVYTGPNFTIEVNYN
jgi:hypothetical protein